MKDFVKFVKYQINWYKFINKKYIANNNYQKYYFYSIYSIFYFTKYIVIIPKKYKYIKKL